ncbi:conidial yellow pigment biosynthesis polyketide synthase [Paecilomyces variotii No. 5]|uniref:Conidial yellow pigment biosynthesis polyketide synthase n=1 Tax=Byssochlamys spectabilis (strain No. 5 / NBRC 109023) TaxID=1356009 RepID=V5GBX6_BYSSN|nr:conidial yellow pigment biosynthesis polyketide synthase [Paecilomyces variotii No. 5]
MDVLLFGDQTDPEIISYLHGLLSAPVDTPLVSSFLKATSCALRRNIADLPAYLRQQLPPFASLEEFIRCYNNSDPCKNAVVESTLLCVAQLADYISLTENVRDFPDRERIILGLSPGLIAGATASVLPPGSAGIPFAVEAVQIAFRLALYIGRCADRLHLATDAANPEPWTITVAGLTEEGARSLLEHFDEAVALPGPNRPYISAISHSAVSLSGPPSTLERLLHHHSNAFQGCQITSVPVFGPYHAPHIHEQLHWEDILDFNVLDEFKTVAQKPAVPVLSPRDGTPYSAESPKALYQRVIADILTSCQNRSTLIAQCCTHASAGEGESRLLQLGPGHSVDDFLITLEAQAQGSLRLFDWKKSISTTRDHCYGSKKDKIAIVGMSGRFPGAQDLDDFWKVPPDRFDAQAHYDPSGKGKNKSHTPFGCFVENAGLFDPRFFNMSPREATQTDPMQRLALITAYEALEMAGYVPNRTPSTRLDRIGTFYGQTSDDWREINEAQDIDTYFITGGVRAFGPGRINYHFGFSGPSFNVDTACSSSMAALHLACNALWLRDCDTAITGGLNIMTNPDIFAGLSKGQFLSKVGPCQTFDNDADGYCRGDGIGTLILKRLSDAEADKDNILGVILSAATNHSADAISITHPHGPTQEILYRRVLDQAGVDPNDIDYVEMHGTGTQAGDDTEMHSVTNVFAPARIPRPAHRQLYLGSVKANVGHGEAASGVTAIIKSLLMLRNSTIPPHVGIKREINKGFPDLAARNARICFEPTPFPRPQTCPRRIFVNNFSAAGGNTAVVMEDGPRRSLNGTDDRTLHVISVSARSLSSLKANLCSLVEYLDMHPDVSLPSLSYTTTARRIHHNYRFSIAARDVTAVKKACSEAAQKDTIPVPSAPRILFTFTGQGSIYPRVSADLFESCTLYRDSIMEFDAIATSFNFPSFMPLLNGANDDISKLPPVLVQVGQVSIEMALTRLWNSWGIKPQVVVGHSLGEYAALFAAGVLSANDTIYLVGSRAQLLENHCKAGSHSMLAVKCDLSTVEDLVSSGSLEIACINSATEIVLSGESPDIDAAKALFSERGIMATRLNVPYAFHSTQIDAIVSDFRHVAASVTFREPQCTVLSPLLGRSLLENDVNADYLCRHARETVNFFAAIETAIHNRHIDDETVFVEIGPHPVCTGFLKSTMRPDIATSSSLNRKQTAWETLAMAASFLDSKGAQLNWNEFHRDFEDALELLELPAYRWSLSNYWIDYRNNWCLSKGGSLDSLSPVKSTPFLPTTAVQNIVEEIFGDTRNMLVAEADLSRPDLRAVLAGHMVNEVALCPSSLYGDIGTTIGQYMYKRMFPDVGIDATPCMNVCNMEVPKTLIAKPDSPQVMKIVATANHTKSVIDITISTEEGDHAKFTVTFGTSSEWLAEWQRTAYLVESRMKTLLSGTANANSHLLRKEMAYKLFAGFVEYEQTFQGIDTVVLDPTQWEATAEIILTDPKPDQSFVMPPYWIDSVGHLSGFIMNVHPAVNNKADVFVSHGWDSMRFARTLLPGRKYQTYVRMAEIEGTNIVSGDVYCFEDSTIIGLFGGLKFMRIPRRVLDQVLPRRGGALPRAVASERPQIVPKTEASAFEMSSKNVTHNTAPPHSTVSVTSRVLAIVAEECGVDQSELADPNNFADLGVDSLMQLAISSRMREELELEVPSSLFIDYPTIGHLKDYLGELEQASDSQDHSDTSSSKSSSAVTGSQLSSQDDDTARTTPSRDTSPSEIESRILKLPESLDKVSQGPVVHPLSEAPLLPHKKATSFLLQGNPKTARMKLFLFPDGGGSAASYAQIPELSPDVVVYGLNSPFMTTPEEYTCGVSGIARYYINEMRRRQPRGPYNVGGWSAGGVIAFEGAQQLIRAGEQVERLILIDSPCPLTIEPLPISLHRWFNTLGLLGDGNPSKIPAWLLPHFQASINALSTYNARSVDPIRAPRTFIIWCEDGVCKNPTDPRPDPYPYGHAQFLLENKTDFGPQLWDAMVGMDNIVLDHVPGNHFTMMRPPYVCALGDGIRRAFIS